MHVGPYKRCNSITRNQLARLNCAAAAYTKDVRQDRSLVEGELYFVIVDRVEEGAMLEFNSSCCLGIMGFRTIGRFFCRGTWIVLDGLCKFRLISLVYLKVSR